MNCKPGDLAVVVRARDTPEMLGRYVVVLRKAAPNEFVRLRPEESGVTWMVRSAAAGVLPATLADGSKGSFLERPYFDGSLKPIRDPGDDAVDESKAWLPPIRRITEMQIASALLRAITNAMKKGPVSIPVPESLRPYVLGRKQRHSFSEAP